MTKYTIDATKKRLGIVASEAAVLLMGKNFPTFRKNRLADSTVEIVNAAKADISEAKLRSTVYTRYSGYPGGFKKSTMKDVVDKKGYAAVFTRAVRGMLPGNKLRAERLKRLTVTE